MGNEITDTSKLPRVEWLFGENPDAIEAQEKEGQYELINSSQLPKKASHFNIDSVEQYKKMGIDVIRESSDDDLFFDVQLPEGWKINPTGHSMWSDLLNEKNEVVASIFYKAAFYDRSAFINFKGVNT